MTDYTSCLLMAKGLSEESDIIAKYGNISALLNEYMEDINWVGFYFVKNDELVLGPFQGKVACTHIKFTDGVCGACYTRKEPIIVDDVHKFSGHIACDSASNSEIVLPIIKDNKVFALLDIDSPILNRFNTDDLNNLLKIVELL